MKKDKRILNVISAVVLGTMVVTGATGCNGNTESKTTESSTASETDQYVESIESTEETEEIIQESEVESEESEAQVTESNVSAESTENSESTESTENTESTETAETAELPTEDQIRECLDRFLDWNGLRMLQTYKDYSELNDDIAISVAACYASNDYDKYEYAEDYSCLKIPNTDVENAMMTLFGKKVDIKKYGESDEKVKKIDDDFLGVAVGDWGLVYPKYDFKINEKDNGEFVIEADYYSWDAEEAAKWDKYNMKARYLCVSDSQAPHGFYIVDMSGECLNHE